MAQHVTFWRMRAQPGKVEEIQRLMQSAADDQRLRERGWQMSLAGRRKENPDEVWGCVTWDTSDRYYANAESPEQNEWYQRMRGLLASDPEWFDCEVIEEQRA